MSSSNKQLKKQQLQTPSTSKIADTRSHESVTSNDHESGISNGVTWQELVMRAGTSNGHESVTSNAATWPELVMRARTSNGHESVTSSGVTCMEGQESDRAELARALMPYESGESDDESLAAAIESDVIAFLQADQVNTIESDVSSWLEEDRKENFSGHATLTDSDMRRLARKLENLYIFRRTSRYPFQSDPNDHSSISMSQSKPSRSSDGRHENGETGSGFIEDGPDGSDGGHDFSARSEVSSSSSEMSTCPVRVGTVGIVDEEGKFRSRGTTYMELSHYDSLPLNENGVRLSPMTADHRPGRRTGCHKCAYSTKLAAIRGKICKHGALCDFCHELHPRFVQRTPRN